MSEANGHREHLEQRAAEVRSRLGQRLRVIDERRHQVAEIARAATRPPASVVLLAAAGAVATLFLVRRLRARQAHPPLLSYLLPPAPVPEKSLLRQGLERVATSLVVVAAQRLGKRGLDQLLAEPPAEPRPFS